MQKGLRAFFIFSSTMGAAACLVLGLTLPVIKLTHLISGPILTQSSLFFPHFGQAAKFSWPGSIFVFSILFPALKLIYIAMASTLNSLRSSAARPLVQAHRLAWQMVDARRAHPGALVFYAKATEFADAVTLPGVYFFRGLRVPDHDRL